MSEPSVSEPSLAELTSVGSGAPVWQRPRLALPALLFVLLGVLLLGLFRVVEGTERHSYAAGAVPPSVVRLTEGRTYHLAVAGGVHALLRRGATVSSPQCSWSPDGASAQVLAVQAESADTKAINTVGSFVSPYTGSVHIGCTGWGAVFVDDADSAGGDTAGVFLLGGVVALTLGLVLALAAARELMTVRNGAD